VVLDWTVNSPLCRCYVTFQESILKKLQDTVESEEQKNLQQLQLYETQLNSVNYFFQLLYTVKWILTHSVNLSY